MVVLLSGCGGYWYGSHASGPDLTRLVVWVDQFFQIKSVEVSEGRTVSREEVVALLGLNDHRGLISTDTAKLKQVLESHPWIQQAEVRRVFPDTLVVELKEREPAAVLRTAGRDLLIGEDGTLIVEATQGTYEGFPVLTGIEYSQVLSRTGSTTERLLAGIALAGLLSEAGANRMEVDLRTPGDAVAYYDGLRVRFGDGGFEDKVERYRRLSEQFLDRRLPGPASAAPTREGAAIDSSKHRDVEVDLRFQDRVIVRDKGGKRAWGEKSKSS